MSPKNPPPAVVPPEFVRRRYAEALPPGDALALELLFALRSGVQSIDNLVSRWLGDDALTPGRWQVLVVLWSSERPLPQREIVAALNVSRATVSALVKTLQREGHVLVAPDPGDGRHALVSLTPAGRAMTDRLIRETAGNLRGCLRLDDAELRLLTGLLSRL